MTEKELSYVEDAISHESIIIKICEDVITKLSDNNFASFMQSEIQKHQSLKASLMGLLRGQSNG